MMRVRFVSMLTAVLLLTAASLLDACVFRTEHTITAHITLDIRHIQEQAAGVLDYVEGRTDTLPALEPPSAASAPGPQSWWQGVWHVIDPIPAAWADDLKNTVSPLVTDLARRMRERNPQIGTYRRSGCFGENNRGYLELRDCDGLKDAEARNAAQKLLAEENKDRKALYNEIARLNADQGVTVSTVESIYAVQRLQRGHSGEVFQLPDAGPWFDEIARSPLGQRLGSQCQPGRWVTLP